MVYTIRGLEMEKSAENIVTPLESVCCVKSHSRGTKKLQKALNACFRLIFICMALSSFIWTCNNNRILFTDFIQN